MERMTPTDAGEGVLDLALWEKEKILSVYGQEVPDQILNYGNDHIISPHIDQLASGGILFERAYWITTSTSCRVSWIRA